ncbi:MAG: rane protein insertase, YidC/Oxa1 family, N-terminal domain protein [Bacteroidota bacterium]|nr:rane protein insertase, YidC/Oxa1 family, N-terminal domain protein [Bacteroidota bacterium]
MKNKENLVGWVLIIVLMIGFVFYQTTADVKKRKELAKQEQEKKAAKAASVTTVTASTQTISAIDSTKPDGVAAPLSANTDTSGLSARFGPFADAAKGEEKVFVLENDVQRIVLTNKGGQIKSVELKKYKTWDKKPLILLTDKTNSFGYQFAIDDNGNTIDTRQFYFEPVGEPFTVSGDSSKSFTLRLNAGSGKYFDQKFTLKGNSYMVNYDVKLVGLNKIIPATNTFINVSWESTLANVERLIKNERRYSALYYKYDKGDVAHLNEDKENDELQFDPPIEWISYKQQFFNTTLFSKGDFHKGLLKTHFSLADTSYVKHYDSKFTLNYQAADTVNYAFQYFMGPNNYNMLAGLDKNVESIIKLSPDFFLFSWIRYITRFIIWVFGWFNKVNLNYGIIILLMTIILKIVLHPLTAKSIESAAKMKILAPELAALKEKYGDDQTKIGAEQMKIYSRAGVSPFGGCLPLLIQMPILMAMYYFFPASIELRQQSFLWATDLSSYDSIVTFSNALPLIGNHISLFTILMTITSVLQAVMNSQMNAMQSQQAGMKYMPYIMPVMLMFMFNDFPAALTYYYLLQNLLGVGHQWIIQKFFINDAKLRKQIEDNKKNPKQASGWQKKLADLQKNAQQRQKAK